MDLRETSHRRRSIHSSFAVFLAFCAVVSPATSAAQTASNASPVSNPSPAASAANPAQTAAPTKPWIVRDPATGRVFQQQLVPVTVPVTRWEAKTIEQTVYEPQLATSVQNYPLTTFVPKTEYVMQPKLRGWWNPLKEPVQAYEYVPKTTWVPQTQQFSKPMVTQNWVPKQQKVVVYQPVQATEVRQQLVQTEMPQPAGLPPTVIATSPRQPLFRLPLLAQQRVLPWPAGGLASGSASNPTFAVPPQAYAVANQATAPATSPATLPATSAIAQSPVPPSNPPVLPPSPSQLQHTQMQQSQTQPAVPSQPQYASSGLRPIAPALPTAPLFPLPRFATRPYTAPLGTATINPTASSARDTIQIGMQPTVLR